MFRWLLLSGVMTFGSLRAEAVHFTPGDAIPVRFEVNGDLVGMVGDPKVWLLPRQECWVDMESMLFSWDGIHWIDFEQFIGGNLSLSIGKEGAGVHLTTWRK